MHDIDLIGILLLFISSTLLLLAIRIKKGYIMFGAVIYSFAALPLIFAV